MGNQSKPDHELEQLRRNIEAAGLAALLESDHEEKDLESADDFVARMKANDARQQHPAKVKRLRYTALAGSSIAAAIALLLIVIQPWSQPVASAETPPLLDYEFAAATEIAYASGEDPRTELLALSSAAAKQLPEPAGGQVQHVVTDNWFANLDDAKEAEIAVVPQFNETWLSPDGSLRLTERRGEPLAADGRGIPPAGSWDDTPATTDETYPAGSNDPDFVQDLPTDTDGIRNGLLDKVGCEDREPGLGRSFCLFNQIIDLQRNYVIPPKTYSAMWEMLAGEEGIRLLGNVEDRAGREGIGISLISDLAPQYRNVLIISPTTGELLGSEEILIKTMPAIDIKAPAIMSFTAFLEAGYEAQAGPAE